MRDATEVTHNQAAAIRSRFSVGDGVAVGKDVKELFHCVLFLSCRGDMGKELQNFCALDGILRWENVTQRQHGLVSLGSALRCVQWWFMGVASAQ